MVKVNNYLTNNVDKTLEKKNILSGLNNTSKKISSIFFYDDTGSKLFEKITALPEYYLTRTEIPLIKKAASTLQKRLKNIDIVEFGSGDGTKISILLDAIPKKIHNTICYIPIDISITAVEKSSQILRTRFPNIKIHGTVADFMTQLEVIPLKTKKLFCFLGSTVGNLSMNQAQHFLSNLSSVMNPDDLLLIGFDMVKNKQVLEQAYNDKQKVTEQFNKNILNVINNQINTDFDTRYFEHLAFFNEELSRIEMHLKAIKDIEIVNPGAPLNILIKKGETIHTENSYKFTEKNIKSLAKDANLDIEQIYSDKNKWFSLVQFLKK